MRTLLLEGRFPESWIPPVHVLEIRTLGRLYCTLMDERRAWQQQPRIGAVGLSALLRTPRHRDLGRITQMHAHPRAGHLFGDVPPPSAALQRELRVPARAVLAQPRPQRLPHRRADLTPPNQPVWG